MFSKERSTRDQKKDQKANNWANKKSANKARVKMLNMVKAECTISQDRPKSSVVTDMISSLRTRTKG